MSDLVDGLYRLMQSDERYCKPRQSERDDDPEFAEHIRGMTSRSKIVFQPLPEDDPKQRRPDITKARSVLGWEPKVALQDGLRDTVEYFQGLRAIVA